VRKRWQRRSIGGYSRFEGAWDRKHTIKALNGKVTPGSKAARRGSRQTHGATEHTIILAVWKHSEQPCGIRLKATLTAVDRVLPDSRRSYGRSHPCEKS
jgi:hypothetical protein